MNSMNFWNASSTSLTKSSSFSLNEVTFRVLWNADNAPSRNQSFAQRILLFFDVFTVPLLSILSLAAGSDSLRFFDDDDDDDEF